MKRFFRTVRAYSELLLAQIITVLFCRNLIKQNIWLFGEKKTEARDNGYYFFKYICENHPEIRAIYAIKNNSADLEKVNRIGEVVAFDSFKHCVYFASAKVRACSQPHGVQPFEDVHGIRHLKPFIRKDQLHINLKHGISKDFIPGAFDYKKAGYDLYVSGAKPEYEAIKSTFNYPEKNIVLSGFCRFDALYNLPEPQKIILIMPTFRAWLRTDNSAKSVASPIEMEEFRRSEYYHKYKELLNNKNLLELARDNGYKIYFYLHYTFQPYVSAFYNEHPDVLTICSRDKYDVQKLLIDSKCLITDFSSVFFDYAYMLKPVVFYQFDEHEYRSKHYSQGYFSYENDGFGPVFREESEVVKYVCNLMKNSMYMEQKYQERTLDFFVPHDNHNCQRVYDAIRSLLNES